MGIAVLVIFGLFIAAAAGVCIYSRYSDALYIGK